MALSFIHHEYTEEGGQGHWDIIQNEKSGIVNENFIRFVVKQFNK